MSELQSLTMICVARSVSVGVAVAVACYVTKSGWPLLGLIFAAHNVRFTSPNTEKEADND